ncbi:DUF6069 family protein [Actinoplanes sp. NPDC023714]|uniref:DUF6069 family protein n=1 Tax=Actinoplanes sp. NPDC023714 TaxID=3154322 RepID=UPI0033E1B6B3
MPDLLRAASPALRSLSRTKVVVFAVVLAVVVNVIVHACGRLAGGSFAFTTPDGPAEVGAVTVAGFSAVPLAAGLVLVALLARRFPWAARAGAIVGSVLAIGTIATMTLPADLDTVSTITLALCHLTLVPIVVGACALLRSHQPGR